ncbi:sulfotransferase 1 family member D1-like isoform 1-T1 [Anomaloglossus baeobatrachus]|uniref:sulfotransferase 1 family member D1-like n=1 Tax=Anomaloglossus baeobatrachus TaxID=238106 RepID=UPI003F4F4EBD
MDFQDEKVKTMDMTALQKLVPIHGVPMGIEIAENWESVEQFQARSDDLLIATYPKAGTTWASEIVDMIYSDGDLEKCRRDAIYNRVPYLEFKIPGMPSGVEQLNGTPSPRLVKTHLPIQLMPDSFWEKNSKVIYVARNAKDVAVSYFFFHKIVKALPDPGPWNTFLENYMNGNVGYGSWHDHVKGWWEKRHGDNILYLFYEDMKEDPKRELRKMLHFMNKEMSDETLEKIIYHTSFDVMKTNDMANYKTLPNDLVDQSTTPFMRKGIAGDWKNHFTIAQNERFDEDYKRKMKGTELHFRTEI